jgi:hypothetical protein
MRRQATFSDLMVAIGAVIIAAWVAILVLSIVRGETLVAGLAGIIIGLETALAAEGARRKTKRGGS